MEDWESAKKARLEKNGSAAAAEPTEEALGGEQEETEFALHLRLPSKDDINELLLQQKKKEILSKYITSSKAHLLIL